MTCVFTTTKAASRTKLNSWKIRQTISVARETKKPIRKVDAESLEVFPMSSDGKLYGAIQTGIHHFYLRENGKADLWTSTAKFTHLWIRDLEGWKLKEVFSYDHQSDSPPLSHRD